jgi:phosphoglucosamine mutase
VGFAFDGDADRLIAVDERGAVADGDALMAALGCHLLARGELPGNTVVATVMSNLGLELCLRERGGRLVRTRVGDRYVLEAMRSGGHALGGEQSGHIIFLRHHTTGDGLLTAVMVARLMRDTDRPLSELTGVMPRLPQVLQNVRVRQKEALAGNASIAAAIAAAEGTLGDRGRVLVRPSGTEPLIRVMVEGEDDGVVRRTAEEIAAVVAHELGVV